MKTVKLNTRYETSPEFRRWCKLSYGLKMPRFVTTCYFNDANPNLWVYISVPYKNGKSNLMSCDFKGDLKRIRK